jgi:hypothetical protein
MNYLIDPERVTNYARTEGELQLFFLFGPVVAGKNARVQAKKLAAFLADLAARYPLLKDYPFWMLQRAMGDGCLLFFLQKHKLGKYGLLLPCFETFALCKWSARGYDLAALEAIPGIGPKTARFLLLHSQPGFRGAVLDTHLLKWLKVHFPEETIPSVTPSSQRQYLRLEQMFLAACDIRGETPAALDLAIWKSYSAKTVDTKRTQG